MENQIQEPAVAYGHRCTPEEYLAMEWVNGVRYEYWDGVLVAMSYATQVHNTITFNTNKIFKEKKGKDACKSFQESIMVRPQNQQIYFLPDVVMTCHPDDLDMQAYEVKNPSIIVEVLSDSTELYDRSQKWEQYRKIKSLRHYLLVSQHQYQVEMFSRTHEHALFYYQSFDGIEAVIPFPDLGFEMGMKEVYDGISLPVQKLTDELS
jgi:Uma2 family endonuclease